MRSCFFSSSVQWLLLPLILSVFALASININNNACRHLAAYPFWFVSRIGCYYNPDIDTDPAGVARRHGYRSESHQVRTADGYILTLFRVLPVGGGSATGQPVFVQHGIATNLDAWIISGNQSLVFYLASKGYDVWLGSFRGSTYSKRHSEYATNDRRYWNYTLDQLAAFDLPAQLEFVAAATGRPGHIIYVGHSQGTTVSYMFAASSPRARALLRGVVSMCPVAYFEGNRPLKAAARWAPLAKALLDRLHVYGLFYQDHVAPLLRAACRVAPYACREVLLRLFSTSRRYNADYLLATYSNFPTGVSVMQLLHFTQLARNDRFAKYDYGPAKNALAYGQAEAPLYDLSEIKLPVYLLYGSSDPIATEINVRRILLELGSAEKAMLKIPTAEHADAPGFAHTSFVRERHLLQLLGEPLWRLMATRLSI